MTPDRSYSAPTQVCAAGTSCPSDAELEGVLTGQLDVARSETVLGLCETCQQCEQRIGQLERSENKTRSVSGKTSLQESAFENESACQDLQQRLVRIRSIDVVNTVARYEGEQFGNYTILSEIASGGMGRVYRAVDTRLDRHVALKLMHRGQTASNDELRRFHTEATAAARLEHSAIVQVLETGEVEGIPFIAMGLVDGDDLNVTIRDRPVSSRAVAEICRQIALAVAYAHSRGVVHRDLKPSNILIDRDGRPKITDFGLAKRVDSGHDFTTTGQVLGTPSYMPPEQARGEIAAIGPLSDIYGLGGILYFMLTGSPPFRGESTIETIRHVIDVPVRPPHVIAPAVDRDIETICLKCLEKDPQRRYQSASDLVSELDRYLRGDPIQARRPSSTELLVKWMRRRPAIASLIATSVVALVAISLAGMGLFYNQRLTRSLEETTAAKQFAEEQRQEAAAALGVAEVANVRAQRAEYYQDITLAQVAWDNDDVYACGYHLSKTALQNRGWEYGYLQKLREQNSGMILLGGCRNIVVSSDSLHAAAFDLQVKRKIKFFETATGNVVRELDLGENCAQRGEFNFDLSRLAVWQGGQAESGIEIWDTIAKKRLKTISATNTSTQFVLDRSFRYGIFVNNGQWRGMTAFSLQDEAAIKINDMHDDSVLAACFDPDGHWVVVSGYADPSRTADSGFIHKFSLPDFKRLQTIHPPSAVSHLAMNVATKEIISVSVDRRIRRLDAESLEERLASEPQSILVYGLDVSPDGEKIAIALQSGVIKELNSRDLTVTATHRGHSMPAYTVRYANGGSRLWSGSGEGRVLGWKSGVSSGPQILAEHSDGIRCIAFSSDSNLIATAQGFCGESGVILVWDHATGEVVRRIGADGHAGGIFWVGFCEDDHAIVSLGWDRTLRFWSVESGEEIAVVHGEHTVGIHAGAISADRRQVYSAGADGNIGIWDVPAKTFRRLLKGNATQFSCSVNPDGKHIIGGGGWKDGFAAQMWSLGNKHTEPVILPQIRDAVRSICFAPDGNYYVCGDVIGRVAAFDTATHKEIWQDIAHLDVVAGVAFSPDGSRMVTVDSGHRVILWEPRTGQQILRLNAHTDPVLSVAFSPDGKTIATGDAAGKLILWRGGDD